MSTALLTDLHLYSEALGIVSPSRLKTVYVLGADEAAWHPGNHCPGAVPASKTQPDPDIDTPSEPIQASTHPVNRPSETPGRLRTATSNCAAVGPAVRSLSVSRLTNRRDIACEISPISVANW